MNSRAVETGNPRLREPVRDQVELRALDLDSLIGPGHPARTIWDYVERLGGSGFVPTQEKAAQGTQGRPGD